MYQFWRIPLALLCLLNLLASPVQAIPLGIEEQALFDAMNQARNDNGIASTSLNDALVIAARSHATDMRDNSFVSHTGSNGSTPFGRIAAAGYQAVISTELIGAGFTTAAGVVNGWLASAPHRSILLDSQYQDSGVGYAGGGSLGHYWTATLASLVSVPPPSDGGGSAGGTGGGGGGASPTIPPGNGCGGAADFAQQAICFINATRGSNGLADLLIDLHLQSASLIHSEDMRDNGIFGHTGSDGSSFFDRLATAGYDGAPITELICGGCVTPEVLVTAWLASAPHAAFLLDPFANEIGLGYASGGDAGHYWTAGIGRRTQTGGSNGVPEPTTILLFALGLAGLVAQRKAV